MLVGKVNQIPWKTPSRKTLLIIALSLPRDVKKCIVNSTECKAQKLREKTAISAVYLNPKLIPSSPAEPTTIDAPSLDQPVKWELNKSPVEEIAIDNKILSANPFLSAIMGQPLKPAWTPMIAATHQSIPTPQQMKRNIGVGGGGNSSYSSNIPNSQSHKSGRR
jgi:hypothetical protein